MNTPHEQRAFDALATVARFRMLLRRQIKRWKFPLVSDTIVKRWTDRMQAAGYLGTERSARNGVQYLWCTQKGRDVLVEHGYQAADLFPARGPVAAKDLQHTLYTVDAAIALHERSNGADALYPAWALQRLYGGSLRAVPDLLALSAGGYGTDAKAVAVEVDLSTESHRVVVAKFVALEMWLRPYSVRSSAAILVLTNGRRRRGSLAAALARARVEIPFAVDLLETFTAISP